MGKYIVIEGNDGSGKSTQAKKLSEKLKSKGFKVILTREPGSHLIDLNIRELVLSDKPISPRALELIFQADRAEHADKIKNLLDDGYWVVSDRSYISGLSYGVANGNKEEDLYNVINFSLGEIRPHYIILLDIPTNVAKDRRDSRGDAETREEKRGLEFSEKVRKNLSYFVSKESNINHIPSIAIDALKNSEEISNIIDKFINL